MCSSSYFDLWVVSSITRRLYLYYLISLSHHKWALPLPSPFKGLFHCTCTTPICTTCACHTFKALDLNRWWDKDDQWQDEDNQWQDEDDWQQDKDDWWQDKDDRRQDKMTDKTTMSDDWRWKDDDWRWEDGNQRQDNDAWLQWDGDNRWRWDDNWLTTDWCRLD